MFNGVIMKIENEILTTRGVNSCVRVESDGEFVKGQRWWTENHIGLFDFDGVSKTQLLNEMMDVPGINIIWRSSQHNYHLWNLTVRAPEEIALEGLRMHCDCKHVSHGFKRRKWVLRIAGKFRDNETEPYKEPPKFLHAYCNPSNTPQSLPHFRLFQALTGKTICYKANYVFIGESAQVETYKTITDRMKAGSGLKRWGK